MPLLACPQFGSLPRKRFRCRFARQPMLVAGQAKHKALRAAGWTKVRQAGSHETWESDDGSRAVTVAGKDSDTVPVGTFGAIRRATGMKDGGKEGAVVAARR